VILKGSQRSGSSQLAFHLLKTEDNEHVELHEVRGFIAEDLKGALHEAYAQSRGTRCKQFMFSLSLNPPQDASVPIEVFDKSLSRIEEKLGLSGQPRIIVFHEKEGRRHAHCVWSRINTDEMKAINLPHYKLKLKDLSKQIYLEQGWNLPKGFIDKRFSNPLNFTLQEWQQAKQTKKDPRFTKALLQECWKLSDSKASFESAMNEYGYYLARGDKRGFVAVDWQGEVYSLSRDLKLNKKEITARLGMPESLPSVDNTKTRIASELTPTLKGHIDELAVKHAKQLTPLRDQVHSMTALHKLERGNQRTIQKARWQQETAARSQRHRKGLKGSWDFLTGKYLKIKKQNETEAIASKERDRAQREKLVHKQLFARRKLQQEIKYRRGKQDTETLALLSDIATYIKEPDSSGLNRQYRQTLKRDMQVVRSNPNDGIEPGL